MVPSSSSTAPDLELTQPPQPLAITSTTSCLPTFDFGTNEETVESGDTDSSSSDSLWEGRTHSAEVWASPGWEREVLTERLSFASVDHPIVVADVTSFIRAALREVAPQLAIDLLPSSMGVMILRCDSRVEHNLFRLASPIPRSLSAAQVQGLAAPVLAHDMIDQQDVSGTAIALDVVQPLPPAKRTAKPTTRRSRSLAAPSRHSERIAAKTGGNFVDMTAQASKRKALLNSLSSCSASLKKHVNKRSILSRNKLPIGVSELRKLVAAASVSCKSIHADAVGVSTDVVE